MSLKQNDEYYEQRRETREEIVWSTIIEAIKLAVLLGLWYVGIIALYAFTG